VLAPFGMSPSVVDVSFGLTAIAGLTAISGDALLSVSETESRIVVMEDAGQQVLAGVTESWRALPTNKSIELFDGAGILVDGEGAVSVCKFPAA